MSKNPKKSYLQLSFQCFKRGFEFASYSREDVVKKHFFFAQHAPLISEENAPTAVNMTVLNLGIFPGCPSPGNWQHHSDLPCWNCTSCWVISYYSAKGETSV